MAVAYLGDGLYVDYDNYQLRLMANSHTGPTDTVYLGPHEWRNLLAYVADLQKDREASHEHA